MSNGPSPTNSTDGRSRRREPDPASSCWHLIVDRPFLRAFVKDRTFFLLMLLLGARFSAAQAVPDTLMRRPERITGRVTSDSGIAIAGAEVFVTRGPDRAFQRDTTNANGEYSLRWLEGTGDYLVFVSSAGRKSFRARVQRRSAVDTVMRVDVVLAPLVTRLQPVRVRAERPKPQRVTDPALPTPGSEPAAPEGLAGALSPGDRGTLSEVAATVPGVIPVVDGFSVLGLGPTQNQVILDGLAFLGGAIPREAKVLSALTTSAYDPSRGGFSGASQAVQIQSGGLFSYRTGSIAADSRPLQASDPVAERTGQRFTSLLASGGMNGPFGWDDRYYYSLAGELSRRSSDLGSVFSASPAVLSAAGLVPDSITRLARVLDSLGVPIRIGAASPSVVDRGSLLARFDWAPYNWESRVPRRNAGAITLYASGRRAEPVGLSPLSAATRGVRAQSGTVGLQGMLTRFLGRSQQRLAEVRTGLTVASDRIDPAFSYPAADVLIVGGEASDAARSAPRLVALGGTQRRTRRQTVVWETRGETQWHAALRHRLKLSLETRFDAYDHIVSENGSGTYEFSSLTDLAANRAARYSRTLGQAAVRGGMWSGAASLGDFWQPTDRVELVYGTRLEGNRYTQLPPYSAQIDSLFGLRSNFAPNRIHVSPRVGFTWQFRNTGEGPGISFSRLGQFLQRPAGYIRGGFGEFRNLPISSVLEDPLRTSLGSAALSDLVCVGSEVPTPNWSGYAHNLPAASECAFGGEQFADNSRRAVAVTPQYDSPRSWRGNIGITHRVHGIRISAEGIFSWNLNQSGVRPLNLRPTPAWMLPGEGRAVYAPVEAILPTGVVSPAASRREPTFGSVTALVSDLRSRSNQLSVTVQPRVGSRSRLSLAYTLGSARASARGADGAAFGDVHSVEWSRAPLDVRHQIIVSAGHVFPALRGTSVTVFGQFRSGLPYTPLVSGDVNGDGSTWDRAFIHRPEDADAVGDPGLAQATRSLLAEAPRNARRCLAAQLGSPAKRNSCEGPWAASMNARIELGQGFISFGPLGNRRRLSVALDLSNPLGGVDQLLHGANDLRGWGSTSTPDPVLYTITGFDQNSRRFRYSVNPRFGSTDPSRSLRRSPFRVTLEIQVNLSRPVEEQQVDRFLARGRTRPGTLLDSAALKARYTRNVPNVYAWTLRDADTLLLTRAQVEALESAQMPYDAAMDSLWGKLAGEFSRLPRNFDPAAVLSRQEEYVSVAWELTRAAALRIRAILTPAQYDVVTWLVKSLVDTKGRVELRFFSG